ncbi:MAG TPA: hypothetical protein VGI70_18425, partial [Polyangiales bacterium]
AQVLIAVFVASGCLPSSFDRARSEAGSDRTPIMPDVDSGAAHSGGAGAVARDAGLIDDATSGDTGSDAAAGSAGESAAGSSGLAADGGGSSGRAGATETAGKQGTAGSGGQSGQAGSADQAGAGGRSTSPCGDTTSDSANCGSCGNDCRANSAQVECSDSLCVRACVSDRRDCNMDLSFGAMGDGCETQITEDVKNCGDCNIRCDRSVGAVATCDSGKCMSFAASVGSASSGSNVLHGSIAGGDPYAQLCGRSQVLVGIDAAFDSYTLYGYDALCADLQLGGTPTSLSVGLGDPTAFALLGDGITTPPTPMRLLCPAGSIVTAVQGATWYYNTASGPSPNLSVKQLMLTCSQIALDGQRHIVFTSNGSLVAGSADGADSTFDESCPAGAAVVGFSGHAGAYIDALQTECAPITLSYQLSGSSIQKD